MPTVLRHKGYRFFFFSLDRPEPIHIHVEKGEKYAKFWLNPISVARSHGFRDHELREIVGIIKDHLPILEEHWHEFFSC
ncbi:MAG: DUF4160 domain-containing protein [Deltaproteobacteria bacterium]|jgi:hypothetical protein|nr:DUF4160 domain-containing protein [Deltaproteobacteria bacterium]